MKMAEVTVPYPAGLEESVQTTREEVQEQIRLMAALKMFELGKLSSGRAAELAGLSRASFFDACARVTKSVFLIIRRKILSRRSAAILKPPCDWLTGDNRLHSEE